MMPDFVKEQLFIIVMIIVFCVVDIFLFRKFIRIPIISHGGLKRDDKTMPTTEAVVFAAIPYSVLLLAVDVYKYLNYSILPSDLEYKIFIVAVIPFCIVGYIINLWMHRQVDKLKYKNQKKEAKKYLIYDVPMAVFLWVGYFLIPIALIHITL